MIRNYLKAGYPALCLLTQEPHRAEQVIPCEGWRFVAWDCVRGIRDLESGVVIDDIRDPVEAVRWLDAAPDAVLMAHNLHLFFEIPEVVQAIQNGVNRWKSIGSALLMISPSVRIPQELEKFFHLIDLPLPDTAAMLDIQREITGDLDIATNETTARLARGLTEFEAETAFAYALVKKGTFAPSVISDVKGQMIRKSGLMQFWEPAAIEDVGGLSVLKDFIQRRAVAFTENGAAFPRPKGILLVGIPGTGKSLASKATASILGWPLIRLDLGALKNSLVGESERRMRQATRVIDAFGHAVIWMDEVEKAFAGTRSSGESDGGTTAGMFGHFLTWMAETTASILVMATANDISKLPPEFMRAGRFDATFFVDLPCPDERRQIIEIMNRKWGSDIPLAYTDRLKGYTGAEIEQLAKDSLYDGLDDAFRNMVPLSRSMKEEVNGLWEWARTRARIANTPEDRGVQRKIRREETIA